MICETTLPCTVRAGAPTTRSSFPAPRTDCGACRPPAELPQAVIKPDRTKGELKLLSPQIPSGRWGDPLHRHPYALSDVGRRHRGRCAGRWQGRAEGARAGRRRRTLSAVRSPALPSEEHLDGRAVRSSTARGNRRGRRADRGCHAISEHAERDVRGRGGSVQRLRHGSLLYAPGGIFPDPERSLAWVDRNGSAEPLPLSLASVSVAAHSHPTAVASLVWTQGDRNVWVHYFSRGVTDSTDIRRQERARHLDAGWHAHHVRIRNCWRGEPLLASLRRKRNYRRLASSDFQQAPGAWTPDGIDVVVHAEPIRQPDPTSGRSRSRAIARPHPFLQTPFNEHTLIFPRMDGGSLTYRTSLDALRCTFSRTQDLARGSRSR